MYLPIEVVANILRLELRFRYRYCHYFIRTDYLLDKQVCNNAMSGNLYVKLTLYKMLNG